MSSCCTPLVDDDANVSFVDAAVLDEVVNVFSYVMTVVQSTPLTPPSQMSVKGLYDVGVVCCHCSSYDRSLVNSTLKLLWS